MGGGLGLMWGDARRNLAELDWGGEIGERLPFPGNRVEPTGYRGVGLESREVSAT